MMDWNQTGYLLSSFMNRSALEMRLQQTDLSLAARPRMTSS